ncbi:MAG: Flp family type IVb pilin [Elusimicrobia bacterium]|nr:Flp family type IVb pilin [Elusimicrobiota bacterium]
MLKRLLKNERAQGMTEYVLVVFLIALLAFVAVQLFGGKVKNAFNKAGTKLDQATKK